MGRKRLNPPAKPMLFVKDDFIASLDNLTQKGAALGQQLRASGLVLTPPLLLALDDFERALSRLD